ncbi:unnamed protein product [Tenebrio molitor]|nr:unnamed protein product [Tenebrio molitor]
MYSVQLDNPTKQPIDAIYNVLKDEYLKTPKTKDEWTTIASRFEKEWNFPNSLGTLDGKHIAFRARKTNGSFYYNYKQFNSIILMALVDADYNSDVGVYSNSTNSSL